MNYRRTILWIIWCCTVTTGLLLAVPQQSYVGRVRSSPLNFTWPDLSSPGDFSTVEQVTRLINSLQEDDLTPATIQDYRFSRLSRDALHLVAVADFSGRLLFYRLIIVSKEGARYRWFSPSSAPPHLLPLEVVDLDADGVEELLIKRLVGSSDRASMRPLYWTSVLNLIDGELRDTSHQHRDFYDRTVVPPHRWLREVLAGTDRVEELAEIDYILFKVRRTFGEATAGLSEAIEWSHSPSWRLQKLAVKALEEIAHEDSISALERLSTSEHFAVAQAAKYALAKARNRQ